MSTTSGDDAGGYGILIVGSGHAGAQTAVTLRQRGFTGTIAILSEDDELPYQRPPLSKEYLLGTSPFDRLLIRPASFWTEREVTLLAGRRVVAVDPVGHTVSTSRGEIVGYGRLVWAAGGRARALTCPGHDLAGVHSIRSRADCDRIRAELDGVDRVVIVGGGYVGLEAAAVLRKLGRAVTVLEAQDRVLGRVAGVALSRFYEAEHRAQGVDVRVGVTVECLEEVDGRVCGVRLADGSSVPAGLVVVGIGIVTNDEPLRAAGADCDNGVLVDGAGRTSLPDVFAVGDCARHENRYAGGAWVRVESVQNATDMALTVASSVLGAPGAYSALPSFWSNQYDLRLQSVGLSSGYDEETVEGDPRSRSFAVTYRRRGEVIAVDCVNATKAFLRARKLLSGSVAPGAVGS